MIVIPNNAQLLPETIKLIEFFNQLEERLQYPNSEGYAEQIMNLRNAEFELIKWGKV